MFDNVDFIIHLCSYMVNTKAKRVFVAQEIGGDGLVVTTKKTIMSDELGTSVRKLDLARKRSVDGLTMVIRIGGVGWVVRQVDLKRIKR